MKILIHYPVKKTIKFFLLTAIFIFLPCFVFASSTDGVIDSTYKYAWGENIGWVNFGASNGNVHITDSGLSGSALSETAGWINLDNADNDGEGNLSGYGWGENVGWINFAPANGGVIINSSGEFTGSALGENTGWIIFGGDYKVKTDWRPRSVRPACNNALDDDGDGLIDYPADLGCESLADTNEIDQGGGLNPAITNPPQKPFLTAANPQGEFKILINNSDEYASKRDVELKLFGGSDTVKMSISNFADFRDAIQIPFQEEIKWELKSPLRQLTNPFAKGGNIETVFVKFYTRYGQPSDVVSDAIILDGIPPEKPIIIYPKSGSVVKTDKPLFKGEAEQNSKITLEITSGSMELVNIAIASDKDGKWSYQIPHPLADSNYQIKVNAKDSAQNTSETALNNFSVSTIVFPPKTIKQENNETIKQEPAKPTEPTELATPTEPVEPVEPVTPPVEPTEPTEPTKPPVEPTKPTEKPEPAKISIQQEVKKIGDKTSSLVQSGSSLINNIFQKTKQGISFAAGKIKETGKTIASAFEKLTGQQKETTQELKEIIATPKSAPIPTPEPKDLPKETVVVKSAYGDIGLTPETQNQEIKKTRNQENKIVSGLSGQEVSLFIKPQGDVLGIAGQILYDNATAKVESEKETDILSYQYLIDILKPTAAFAQEETQTRDNINQTGGWKIKEFYYNDEDNNGIYKAQIKLPGSESNYTIRTLIAYENGNIKSIDTPLIVNSHGYVYQDAKIGMIRVSEAKITLFKLNEQTKQYEIFESSSYNKENPQTTNQDGTYSFLAAKGTYRIKVQAKDYKDYISKEFSIKDGEPINFNIELKRKFDWIRALEFALIILVAIGIVSISSIFFYARRAKKRKQ